MMDKDTVPNIFNKIVAAGPGCNVAAPGELQHSREVCVCSVPMYIYLRVFPVHIP
jgi:hypothetical protein